MLAFVVRVGAYKSTYHGAQSTHADMSLWAKSTTLAQRGRSEGKARAESLVRVRISPTFLISLAVVLLPFVAQWPA